MSGHTQGPWKSHKPEAGLAYPARYIYGKDGLVAVARAAGGTLKTAQANARLIAAAPDLLRACAAAALYFDEHPGILLEGDEKLIREAIAKAI